MSKYSLSHLSDRTLLRDLVALVARDRATTAALLAHLAEVDARKLYLPAAYPSMYAWSVGELHMSEDTAYKRIRVARAARRFPIIFEAIAEGRLHLSSVVLLAPYLSEGTADELLAAAARKSKSKLEQLLAQCFPRPDVPTTVQALSPDPTLGAGQHAPGRAAELAPGPVESSASARIEAAATLELSAPGRIEAPAQ